MKLKKYSLVILSILLILLIFVSSASAADANKTDILSIDESANLENNLLSIDNNVESNKLDNNTLKASNDEILTAGNNKWYVNGSMDSGGDGKTPETAFKTLTQAIEASRPDDTIMIASGEFKGTDNIGLTIGVNLNFIKYGDGDAILNAEESSRIWTVTAGSINIIGLTFKNGKSDKGGAIYFENAISKSNINASFINNAAEYGGANYFNNMVVDATIGGTYTNNIATKSGGANHFNNKVSDSTITGTYTNNTAKEDGGANCFWGSVYGLNITGTYTNNKATKQGGANNLNIDVSDSTITGTYTNNTAAYGGANSFNNTISDSTITGTYTNNKATKQGGANNFNKDASNSNIAGTYTNNNATYGGANHFNKDASNSNIAGTYTNNTANEGGANYFNTVSNSNITGTYTNNTANEGGANYFSTVSNSNITGRYTNNTATNSGGANHFNNKVSDSTITGTYTNNKATNNDGGANHFSTVSNSNVNGTYANNKANITGGANHFNNTISNSNVNGTYTNNRAEIYGGANNFNEDVSGSTITGTYTDNISGYGGGANNFNNNVSDSTITGTYANNTANSGGANYFNNNVSDSTITGTYTNNQATNNDGGANHFYNNVSDSTITGTYTNNYATWNGGANYFQKGVYGLNVTGTYTNNRAGQAGGANSFWDGVSDSTITGTYTSNTAGNGAANYFKWNFINSNTTGIYINNNADGSIIHFQYDDTSLFRQEITNAIFLNNTCYIEISSSKAEVDVKDCWFGDNANTYTDKPFYDPYVKINKWLFLNATVSDSSLLVMDSSNITFKLYSTDGENVSDFDNSKMPIVNLTLEAIKGVVDKTTTTFDKVVKYTATERGEGSVNVKVRWEFTVDFKNSLRNFDLSASAQNITYLENETLTLTYNNTATGKINITLKSKNYNKTIEQDINQTITITDLPIGDYDVTVKYFGDNVFLKATAYTNFTVQKATTEIIPDKETIDLFIDNETKITYTLKPDYAIGTISFSSDNPNIVSVDSQSGDIIAKGEGTANITISFSGSENYTSSNATIKVNVKKIPTKITVNSSAIDMKVTDEEDIGAGLEPADAGNLTYKSSNETIVKVEDGKIIALKEGNATITVSFKGDDKYAAAENKTINVTVTLNDTSVSVNNNTLNLLVDDKFNLIATTEPKGLTVNYASSNPSIVTVDNKGNVVAVSEGNTTITVSTGGDGIYAENSTTVTVTVSKIPTEISSSLILVGNKTVINATLTPPEAGNVTFTSSDKNIVTVDNQGNIIAVGEGTAAITVSFAGDKKYLAAENKTINVSVQKVNTAMDISAGEITEGENATISVTLPSDATGNVTAKINGKTYTSQVKNGKATITIPNLSSGNYTVPVTYSGDNKYKSTSKNTNINVNKANATMTVDAPAITVGENATVTVTLPEDATGNVTAKINGKTYTSQVKNGKATITIPNLSSGNYTVPVTYSGDNKYKSTSKNTNINVNKANATMTVDAPAITVGENATVTVTLPEDATGNVTAKINGKTYTSPISEGKTTITVPGLTENATAVINYPGDDKYNPAMTSVNITVNKNTVTINAPDVTKYYTGPERFVVNITDSKGTPLSNKNVTIVINGRSYNKVTDENGTVSLGLNLNSGVYNVISTVDNQTVISLVTILPTVNATDVVKMYKNGTQYYATFRDSKGNYLADGTTVKFNINGVFYERKVSGDKGLAKLNINLPSGEYVITASNPSTGEMASNKVTVLATLAENRNITKYYKNATQYTVKVLGANGNPVGAGKTVTFNINGVMYQRQTNESGIAQLSINLPPGDYTITASYEGYNVANTITVLPVLSASDLKMKYLDGSQFKATLLDGQGKPYPNKNVTFNINGVFYNRATGDDGVAKLNIRLPAGEYIITSSYNGCNIANKITIS